MSAPSPDVTVIVPAYRAGDTLTGCVEALLTQGPSPTYEIVIVASADSTTELPIPIPDERVTLLTQTPRLSAAQARNKGAQVARGKLLVFVDADVIVDPGWLGRLVKASAGETCVAGAVRNGTPTSAAGTVEYLVEFLDLHPARPPRTAWHGATCNLLVPRSMWDRLGPFPEDMEGGEDTLLTGRARAEGLFTFAPEAIVSHLNRTRLRDVISHQYMFGRFTAHLGRRGPYKLRPLVRYTALAPVATGARFASLYGRVIAWMPGTLARSIVLFPMIASVLIAWGAGLLVEGARIDLSRSQRLDGSPDH